jgi:hypothetical protein
MGQSSGHAAIDSWKQRRLPPQSTKNRSLRRICLTALVSILAGVLIWVLSSLFWSRATVLVSLPIVHHGDLVVPPVAYWNEDTRAFLDLSPDSAREFSKLDDYKAIPGLKSRLPPELIRAGAWLQPQLILQVTGHGVSDDGEAWLLCSDYNPQTRENRYRIAEFLSAVSESPAYRKIVILDVSHILSDPRLGMLVNEFPRLLESAVHGIPDPNLWVLASCSPGEISQVCRSQQQSLFGALVTEGLHGAAADARGEVDLDSLFHHVRRGAAAWRLTAGNQNIGPKQTPVLLRGGVGRVDPPPQGIALWRVPGGGRGAREPAAAKDDSKAQTTAAAAPGDAAKATVPATPPRGDSGLSELWQLHDALQNRTGDGWTPVDYAPHLWRQWQAQLIAFERMCQAGSGYTEQSAGKGKAFCKAMNTWLAKDSGDPDPADPLAKLDKARRRFQLTIAAQGGLSKELRLAIQLRNDLAYQAPYYVRWHAGLLRLPPRQHRLYPEILRLLEELQAFSDELDTIGTDGKGATGGPSRLTESLSRRVQSLQELSKRLQDDGLQIEAREMLAAAAKTPQPYGLTDSMDALLATPLLPAKLRTELLNARGKMEQPLPDRGGVEETDNGLCAKLSDLGARLYQQGVLERRLIGLTGGNDGIIWPAANESWEDDASRDKAWLAYRKVGKQVEEFYRMLPERVNELNSRHTTADARRGNCFLRLVDARDTDLVNHELVRVELPVMPALAPEVAIRVSSEELTLAPGTPGALQLDLQIANASAEEALLSVDYDPSDLQFTRNDESEPLPPNAPNRVRLKQNAGRVSFAVVPRRFSGATSVATLQVTCLGKKWPPTRIRCKLPNPDRFELIARRVGSSVDYRAGDDSTQLTLRPFPNRQTLYRLELANQSGRKARLLLDWYAIAKLSPRYPTSQFELVDAHGDPLPGIEKLGPTIEVALSDDEKKPSPIAFPAAKPTTDKTEKPAGGSPPAVAISGGMACILRDAASKDFRGVRWLRFSPLAPSEYVEPSVSYDYRNGQIKVEVKAPRAADFPPLSESNKIQINMDVDPAPVAGLKNHDELIDRDTPARLFADVKPEVGQRAVVSLTIDGYPRALLYEVDCEKRNHDNVPPKRDESAIRIHVPKPAYLAPLREPIPALVQVDAPAVAFREFPGSNPDVVKLRVFDAGERQELCREVQFFTDRMVAISYQGGSPDGNLQVYTQVSDFEIPVQLAGLENQQIVLRADLLLTANVAEELRHKSHTVPVILDGNKPEFTVNVDPPGPFRRGQKIKVYASVQRARSGVEKVEFGIQGKKAEEFAQAPEPIAGRNEGSNTWSAELPTTDLKPGDIVLVCVVNRVGLKAWRPGAEVRFADPPPQMPTAAADAPKPKMSVILGEVVWEVDGTPVADMNVSIRELPHLGTATTRSGGTFRFVEIPPGKYHLDAKGAPKGREVAAEEPVTVPGPHDPTEVKIKVRW